MKKIVFLLLATFLIAENLKITSKYFHYITDKRISEFKGDVNATKGQDNILANEMKIYFNQNKKPVKFIAQGNVKFTISLDQNNTYKGKCNKLIYQFNNGDIYLLGNAKIIKIQTNESLSGDKIILNRKTKNATVEGNKKPVEIIIKVNE
jgi:lipopolysaccharide export system protein LptA